MFGLFKKKEPVSNIINKVWVTQIHKLNGCLEILKAQPNSIFVTWFEETYETLNKFLQEHGFVDKVIMYRHATTAKKDQYIFAEHYPLNTKENELYNNLGLTQITVLCSLDEPLFKSFGSDKIISVLKAIGIKEDELIEHDLITQSIKKAQDKINKSILIDNTATSQEDWLRKNLK
jgi:hypothetical protein